MVMKNKTLMITAFFMLFLLFSCHSELQLGSVDITIAMSASAQMTAPILDEDFTLRIVGIGPDGSSFEHFSGQCITQIEGLYPGEWIIQVQAWDYDGTIWGIGVGKVLVEEGKRVQATILLAPAGDCGSLDLTLHWNEKDIADPSIRARLYPDIGFAKDLDFALVDAGEAYCFQDAVPVGFHTLAVQLMDAESLWGEGVVSLFVSCDHTTYYEFTFDGSKQESTGRLSIAISSSIQARTILPDTDMTVESYDLYGTGPNGLSFVRFGEALQSSFQLLLAPGVWNIHANALNPVSYLVGEGEGEVTVRVGRASSVVLDVHPLEGDGTFRVQLALSEGSVNNLSLEINLYTSVGDSVLSERIPVTDQDFQYENSSIEAGYYRMVLRLFEGDAYVWGTIEALRIIAGGTSESIHAVTL
jgi:hypothetical protein